MLQRCMFIPLLLSIISVFIDCLLNPHELLLLLLSIVSAYLCRIRLGCLDPLSRTLLIMIRRIIFLRQDESLSLPLQCCTCCQHVTTTVIVERVLLVLHCIFVLEVGAKLVGGILDVSHRYSTSSVVLATLNDCAESSLASVVALPHNSSICHN